jgi:DNA-binding response OmpR family regulator
MSRISGLELKKRIFEDERLRLKCIPFIFLSTSGASDSIMRAYSFGVQGYFIKPNSFDELKARLQSIVSYWEGSQHPNR